MRIDTKYTKDTTTRDTTDTRTTRSSQTVVWIHASKIVTTVLAFFDCEERHREPYACVRKVTPAFLYVGKAHELH